MSRPSDIPAFVKALHNSYQARTGYSIRYNPHRERQWWDWCEWADWEWTEADLARVIGYLRGKISKGERNEGALKFDNLIGNPPGFEEDLNLAKEAARSGPCTPRRKPSPSLNVSEGLTNTLGEKIEAGGSFFKSLLSEPPR